MTRAMRCLTWICLIQIICVASITLNPPQWIQGESASLTCTTNTSIVIISKDSVVVTTCFLIKSCNIEADHSSATTKYNYNRYYTVNKISNSVTINIDNVSKDRDDGQWKCEYQSSPAENITVDVKAKPDLISDIKYSPPSDNSICITWTPGFNGGDQQEFIVQHSVDNKTWTSSTPLPESKPDYCIKNLQADTPYYIRVIARNKYSDSQPVYLISSNGSSTVQTLKAGNVSSNESLKDVVVGVSVLLALVTIMLILTVLSTIYYRRKYQQSQKGSEISTTRQPSTTGYDNNGLMSTYDGLEFSERNPTEGTYQDLVQNSTNVGNTASNRMGDPPI